jgi:hypothetical protein
VGGLWVESLDALATGDPGVQQAAADLLSDEGNSIDLTRSPIWNAQAHVGVG